MEFTSKYKLVIFDWDGTLMDSTALIARCVQNAFEDLALPIPSTEAAKNIIGLGLKEAVLALYPGADSALVEKITDTYRTHFIDAKQNRENLFPGTIDMLDQLKSQGYQLAVATGKSRRGLDKVLADSDLSDYFVATRAADETKSKPHPLMLHEILQQLNLSVKDSIMVGDTEYDLQMA